MAPPANRRTGSNKKAQLGLFAGYLAASAGLILGAALLALSLWRPHTFSDVRMSAADVAAPVGSAGAAGRSGSRNVFQAIAGYYRAGRLNAELQREVELARVKLVEARALEQENARLKAL